MTKNIAIGIDIGGSHISCAACHLLEKKFIAESFAESDLDNKGTSDEIIEIWIETISKTIQIVGIENLSGIGFAMPGPFNYEKGIALFTSENAKYENIFGLNIPKTLRKNLQLPPDFPIRFINDAIAFAIGEDWIGKASGASRSLSITLGTGFGSSFLKDSLPVVSGNDVPRNGYVWHLPFDNGIADDYFSTRGLVKRYSLKSGIDFGGVKEIAEAAETGKIAQALFYDFGTKLVDLLKPWILKFGVEILVIGGNISNAFPLFIPAMNQRIKEQNLHFKIEISELKETASIVGSARLCEPDFWNKTAPLLKNMN